MSEIIDIFGLDWRLLLIQMLNFGLLLLVLWYVLYRPLVRIMSERQQKIEAGVRDADAAKEKLAKAEEEKKFLLQEAEKEAEGIVGGARLHAKESANDVMKNAQERSEALIKDAEARGMEEEKKRVRESEEEIARLAVLGAKRILEEKR
ncbi:MAG: F0F1 ATP synthase subunit B [Candidatus Paceibacterota bacterium]